MSEADIIKKSPQPYSKVNLIQEFKNFGLEAGMTIMVHSSLSKIGYVPGGSIAVIAALMEVITAEGTLIMPTHSTDLSDPADWENPPIPKAWQQTVRDIMPAFDPALTPTRGMGVIPESFRTWPHVLRSGHPQHSFAAWGKHAEFVTENHTLKNSMGETSPLARLYELDGYVLLLGVGHGNNSSFHLAEYRADCRKAIKVGMPLLENGRRRWAEFDDIDIDEEDFPKIGEAFEAKHLVKVGHIGIAESRLFSQKTAVNFATDWLKQHQIS